MASKGRDLARIIVDGNGDVSETSLSNVLDNNGKVLLDKLSNYIDGNGNIKDSALGNLLDGGGDVISSKLDNINTTPIENSLSFLAMKVATDQNSTKFNMVDSVIDAFYDDTGVDTGNSTSINKVNNAYRGASTGTSTGVTGGDTLRYVTGSTTEYIHVFTTTGNSTIRFPNNGTIDVLLVGGGGAGSNNRGGGGSGGKVVYQQNVSVNGNQDYTITVGGGGIPVPYPNNYNATTSQYGGGHTTAFGYEARGGNPGGTRNGNWTGYTTSHQGGDADNGSNIGGWGGTSYGNSGGAGSGSAGGGGAGDGGAGSNASGNNGGNGGAGTLNTITGDSWYYAGGGGGSGNHRDNSSYAGGSGGIGGGGAGVGGAGASGGGSAYNNGAGASIYLGNGGGGNGAPNSGAGGGGAGVAGGAQGGEGGAGIVIVRYTESDQYETVAGDGTLISSSTTAESQPTTGDLVLLIENTTGTAILNTDIKGYVSRDDGTTWTQGTLIDEGSWGQNKRIIAFHDLDISSQPSGTSMRYKIETLNQSDGSKETRIHSTSLGWG